MICIGRTNKDWRTVCIPFLGLRLMIKEQKMRPYRIIQGKRVFHIKRFQPSL